MADASLKLASFAAILAVSAVAAAPPAAGVQITGSARDDVLTGGPAADTILAGAGNDQIRAGGGDDVVDGGPGADDISGGPGVDAVTYANATGPVTVTLDGLANDGVAGEQDNIHADVESVFGGPFGDRLTGSAAENTLDAGAGDDRVDGGGGEDALYAGDGDDRVLARDGREDIVDCGGGQDIAIVDELDSVAGCEIVDRRPAVPYVDATVPWSWAQRSGATFITRIAVQDVRPRVVTAELRCQGRGCPFKVKRATVHSARSLGSAVRSAALQPGARLELRLSARGYIGLVVRFTIRARGEPGLTELCLVGRRQRLSRDCPRRRG